MGDSNRPNAGISLDELLADPLIGLIMRADKVDPAQIRELYRRLPDQYAGTTAPPADGRLAIAAARSREFRPGVGIMLLNRNDRVLVGRRTGTPHASWQMPQGASMREKRQSPPRCVNCGKKSARIRSRC